MGGTNSLAIGTNRALYIGELPATGWHRHASAVLLIGLSGRFAVHLAGGVVNSCHSVLIDAGIDHVFDPCGERVALMYLEPDSPEARSLRRRFREIGPVIWDPAVRPVSRSSFGSYLGSFDLPSLLRHPCPEPAFLDPRVENSLRYLRLSHGGPADRQDTAAAVQLSASRFNHLFRTETGVSFRSYRIWSQVRRAMLGLAPRINLTEAALHGDFSDSSHFSRTFRKTFGMTPSTVLKPLKALTVI
jgi:AraC-like DNA-binding protein